MIDEMQKANAFERYIRARQAITTPVSPFLKKKPHLQKTVNERMQKVIDELEEQYPDFEEEYRRMLTEHIH